MPENIISILSRANQELFHSAFLAWLLTPVGDHGLNDRFLRAVLARLPLSYSDSLEGNYEVKTEFKDRRSRFDILLRPNELVQGATKGLVLENKVKSFGVLSQCDGYKDLGYNVAVLALLNETIDSRLHDSYPVIEYRSLVEIIDSMGIDVSNGYQFIVKQYADFIRETVRPFDLLRRFALGSLDCTDFLNELNRAFSESQLSQNDIRTLDYFYYHNFGRFLTESAPDLCFGELGYDDAKANQKNTGWIYEKNLQGGSYMEVLLCSPLKPNRYWRMPADFSPLFEREPFELRLRIELDLDLRRIAKDRDANPVIGRVMLGAWGDQFKMLMKAEEPYRSIFKSAGHRNFHRETIRICDLPFANLSNRLRTMLAALFIREA